MCRGVELRALDVAVAVLLLLHFDIHPIDSVVGTQARLQREVAELVGQHSVCRVNLTTVVEGGVEVIAVEELLLAVIPLAEGVITVLAI